MKREIYRYDKINLIPSASYFNPELFIFAYYETNILSTSPAGAGHTYRQLVADIRLSTCFCRQRKQHGLASVPTPQLRPPLLFSDILHQLLMVGTMLSLQ